MCSFFSGLKQYREVVLCPKLLILIRKVLEIHMLYRVRLAWYNSFKDSESLCLLKPQKKHSTNMAHLSASLFRRFIQSGERV